MYTLPLRVLRAALLMLVAGGIIHGASQAQDGTLKNVPEFAQIRALIESHFKNKSEFDRGDLITRGDAAPVLQEIEALGWKGVAQSAAAKNLLDDNEFLARELRSAPGKRFLRRASSYRLIYDRLDRISRAPGGPALIHDLIRLPDGHRYAKSDPGRGIPSLTDLLPKNRSGKTARVADLDKPTGRIYTLDDFLKQLEAGYREAYQP
ncbi:MAG: hypothetical protein KY475_27360 [Planctomycetes bacterium]|nr:hypothetical protein [Planctomycetota bacterium]